MYILYILSFYIHVDIYIYDMHGSTVAILILAARILLLHRRAQQMVELEQIVREHQSIPMTGTSLEVYIYTYVRKRTLSVSLHTVFGIYFRPPPAGHRHRAGAVHASR